jgi:plastin-1
MILTYDTNQSQSINFEEFVGVMNDLADGKTGGAFGDLVTKAKKLVKTGSAVDGRVVHSYAEEERAAFADHINSVLAGDKDVSLPINPDDESLFRAMADGVLLCKVINSAVPGTIFEKALNIKPKNQHKVVENQNLAINSCKSIGCQVVNIGSQDLIEGKPHLVLGLLWQIIKIGLLQNISLKNCPELIVLLNDGESLADFMRLPPEQILLRWVNYHLKKAGSARVCSNFSGDIKDSEIYTVLMNQICPDKCSMAPMRESDTRKRAEQVLSQADRIGCRKFVTPKDIVAGNSKLNLAFTATLFNAYPALVLPADRAPLDMAGLEEDAGDSREERVFRNWMNSLPIDTFVQNLFFDTTDGVIHLETLEKIAPPGTVDWKTLTKVPKMVFKKVENANAVVLLCKQLKFSMTNIGGKDLVDMNKKLILGMTWQMMRYNLLAFLKTIGGGREIGEDDLVAWANETVKSVGFSGSIGSVRDGSISSGVFFFHVLKAIEVPPTSIAALFLLVFIDSLQPDVINWEIVTPGVTDEDKKTNAMLEIALRCSSHPCAIH